MSTFYQPKITLKAPLPFQLGDTVTAKVSLKPITGLLNEVGFDAETYALSQSIVGHGAIQSRQSFYLVSSGTIRGAALEQFNRHTYLLANRDILLALMFGVRDELKADRWRQLQQSGLSHLIAISGLHIGIAFGIGWSLGRGLLRAHWTMTFAPTLFGLALAMGYAWLAGFSIPTQRAMLMCVVLCLVQHFPGQLSYRYKWLFVLSVLLTVEPYWVVSSSLWLSMAAVGFVFIFLSVTKRSQSSWVKAIKLQAVIVLLMLPITALLFHGISLSAFVYNLIFVPWFTFIVVPMLFFTFSVSYLGINTASLWSMADLSLAPVIWAIDYAQWGWVDLSYSEVKWLGMLVALLLAYRVLNKYGVIAVLAICVSLDTRWQQQPLWELSVFDVGHGLAIAVKQNNRVMLYDTGAAWGTSSIAEQIISPYLVKSGVSNLDYLVLSHMDNDHAGGWQQVVDRWQPESVITSQSNVGEVGCIKGQTLTWNLLTIEVLWPVTQVTRAYNPHSCVLSVTHQSTQQKVLLTGDIETIAEWMLIRDKDTLDSDVVIVPHHGSKTSSITKFIEIMSPSLAIASTAKGGRWDLPNLEVVERYKNQGAVWADTGSSGQILVKFYSDSIEMTRLREIKGGSWYRHMLRKGVE
ncbi:predicted hydrolase of the metallo-beta-lactamase superfamily [Vibrio orientalis CIP 102891 = ATCC 33934]|uniref:Predicted hydrolase of the metallo-beta-lactamase superfamily n=1 Tax=Vibrio orientalis CIP 102891 = ATCC 33934 TaxID=675816 RepID=A0ABP2H0D9_VIBOR|nr:predicted hydrolase of the metallo-beta-lactamase superfamily [Vibrio orientalis CIP 102891 = ATCC 33934]